VRVLRVSSGSGIHFGRVSLVPFLVCHLFQIEK
jgi:hypothetical protein